jgi:chromosome segregation ATPase
MPAAPDTLPDDIEALKALLRQRDGELQQLRDTVSTLEQALSVRSLEIEQLKLQLAKLRRMQFGRKSEKLDRQIEQLETRLEDLLAEEGESQDREAISGPRRQGRNQRASRCRRICHARSGCWSRWSRRVRPAAASSSRWAKMSPNSST